MKIEADTFAIVVGSEACNARCPFCISKMTPPMGMDVKAPLVNWRNFRKAGQLAKSAGVNTAFLTGKGEPTLFPDQITDYLEHLQEFDFPLIEMQTNGIRLAQQPEKYNPHLRKWYDFGLTTIALSVVHYLPEKNRQIYLPYQREYIDLPRLIDQLHIRGFSTRLTCMLVDGWIDSVESVTQLINFAKNNNVEQLTLRPITRPSDSRDLGTDEWTEKYHLKKPQQKQIEGYLELSGFRLRNSFYGAKIYDVQGQNVCLTNCLTVNPSQEPLRQLIFLPDGHIRYDWQYEGAIIL